MLFGSRDLRFKHIKGSEKAEHTPFANAMYFVYCKERYWNLAHDSSKLKAVSFDPLWAHVNSPVLPVVNPSKCESRLILGTSEETSWYALGVQLIDLVLHQRN